MSISCVSQPEGALSIEEILKDARSHLHRLDPSTLHHELTVSHPAWGPTHIIDIRTAAQRSAEGDSTLSRPSSSNEGVETNVQEHKVHVIERNVLEWRLDPQCTARNEQIISALGYGTRVVVVCSEGYTSPLAARELQRLGLQNATDLDGGYWAWKGFLDGMA